MKKILFVDDSMFIRKFFGPKLQAAGYQVIMAVDGQDALTKATALVPDLVILDIDMPSHNGKDAAIAIKRTRELINIPIIIASAHITPEIVATLSQLDVKTYIAKPYTIEKLLEKIKELIG